ncbi:unnamed protein product [Parnassius apollo]|nr:unnamed protein product [Parnassius apollo]
MWTKLPDVFLEVSANNFDLIVLTETWLNDSIFDSEIFDSRYQVFRRDRSSNTFNENNDGGGVAIAVKKSISAYRNHNFESRCEDLWVTLELGNYRICVCSVYLRSPLNQTHLKHFTENAGNVINNTCNDILIFGDFNLRDIVWTPSNADSSLKPSNFDNIFGYEFVDFLSSYDLKQYSQISNHQAKILDLVPSNTFCDISV